MADLESKILQFEDEIRNSHEDLHQYHGLLFVFHEPRDLIQKATNPPVGRGRKPSTSAQRSIFIPEDYNEIDSPLVYVHMLYTQGLPPSYSGISNKIIRIFDPQENIWRDATPIETRIYSQLIDREIDRELNILNRYDVYGVVLSDGKFRLIITSEIPRDPRMRYFGHACNTYRKSRLIDVMWNLGVPLRSDIAIPDINTMLNYVTGFDPNTMDQEKLQKLVFYYGWIHSNINLICQVIYDHLRTMGRIYNAYLS